MRTLKVFLLLLILFSMTSVVFADPTTDLARGAFRTTYNYATGKIDFYRMYNGSDFCLIDGTNCALGNGSGNGSQGLPGVAGLNGTRWFLNTSYPTGVNVNDSFLNTSTGVYHKWNGSSWVLQGNFTGEKGAQGNQGVQGNTGDAGAAGVAGLNGTNASVTSGDLYINITNGVVRANITAFDLLYYGVGNSASYTTLSLVVSAIQNATICHTDGTNCPASSGDNASWNEYGATLLFYPRNSNPQGFYNSSTIPSYVLTSSLSGAVGQNLTYALVSANVGNWSADKSSYTLLSTLPGAVGQNLTYALVAANIGNWTLDKASYVPWTSINGAVGANLTLANINTNMGNWSADKASYVLWSSINGAVGQNLTLAGINANMGNYSANPANYVSLATVTSSIQNATICHSDGTNCPASSGDNSSWNETKYYLNATASFYPLTGNPSNFVVAGTETDPVFESLVNTGALNEAKWCYVASGQITCDQNPPTGGVGLTTIASPNASVVVAQNTTHANVTVNLTYVKDNCAYITGSSALCDGSDAEGSGGSSTPTYPASVPLVYRQAADLSSTDAVNWVNTDFVMPVNATTHYFLKCNILTTGAAATTGLVVNVTTTSSVSNVNIVYDTWSSATANVGFSSTSFSTALTGTGSGATVVKPSDIYADFYAISGGNVTIRMRSEVAASASTVVRGSTCTLYNMNNTITTPIKNATGSYAAVMRQNTNVVSTLATTWNNTLLNFTLAASTSYSLKCNLLFTGAAATTGQAYNLSTTASTSNVNVVLDTWSSATAPVGFSATAFPAVLTGTGSGAAVVRPNWLYADFTTSSTGVLNLQMRSEVGASASTLVRGSICELYNVT